jgi:deazaflavin-dependent oxidoreductase (nitroreductase family)
LRSGPIPGTPGRWRPEVRGFPRHIPRVALVPGDEQAGRSGRKRRSTLSATPGREAPVFQPAPYSRPTAPAGPVAPIRPAGNALHLGPRTRRVIRSVARLVNPLVLRIAGRRHMPVVGIVHHRGRKTDHPYATPLGIRPAAAGGFVMPLTFGEAAGWYRNIMAAGWCVITWRGANHTVASPVIIDRATALPAFPRYERLALRAIGINEFVWLHDAPTSPESGLTSPLQ